jgi:murein DD-endopeptidase MepM/ murein hydrolase activator NlpD
MSGAPHRWTIQLVRSDGRRSRTLSAGRGAILVGALAVLVLILIGGIAIGRGLAAKEESERIAELTEEARVLRERSGDLAELTQQLESIESAYARLRAAVTEGAGEAPAAPRLPTGPGAAGGAEAGLAIPAWPLAQRGFVTRTYGSSGDSSGGGHTGVDIAVPSGSYVRATQAGVVEEAGEDDVYGRYVRIAHGDAISSLYGHNSWLFVQPGDSVERLQVIALSGNTGRSTAPHLHFEIRSNGELIDPLAFVNQGGGTVGRPRQNGVEPR